MRQDLPNLSGENYSREKTKIKIYDIDLEEIDRFLDQNARQISNKGTKHEITNLHSD